MRPSHVKLRLRVDAKFKEILAAVEKEYGPNPTPEQHFKMVYSLIAEATVSLEDLAQALDEA